FGPRSTLAHGSVGHQTRSTADHEPRRENVTAGRDTLLTAAIDHKYVCGRDTLDAPALWVLGIFKCAELVEILARRDIAHCECWTDKIADRRIGQASHTLNEHIAIAALEQ